MPFIVVVYAWRGRHLRVDLRHLDTKAPCNFLIGLDKPAQIATKPVFVHFLVGFCIPKATVIGADFISKHDFNAIFGVITSKFQLEINQPDANSKKQAGQKIINA